MNIEVKVPKGDDTAANDAEEKSVVVDPKVFQLEIQKENKDTANSKVIPGKSKVRGAAESKKGDTKA